MEDWQELPDVILQEIYSCLSQHDRLIASSTCKRWRLLLYHPKNWSHITFDFTKSNISRESFLTSNTAHFISKCTIKLPNTDGQVLLSSNPRTGRYPFMHFEELQRLLLILAKNANVHQLAFEFNVVHSATACSTSRARNSTSITNTNTNSSDTGIITADSNSSSSAVVTISSTPRNCAVVNRVENSNDNRYLLKVKEDSGLVGYKLDQNACTGKSQRVVSDGVSKDTSYDAMDKHMDIMSCLKKICSNSSSLGHLSLGFLPCLTQHRSSIVDLVYKHQHRSIHSLHISEFEYDEHLNFPLDVNQLLSLRNLQHLSLNMHDSSDMLLISLTEGGRAKLQSLTLNLWKHNGVRPIRNRTWNLVSQSCPDLKLTLNIIRCPEAVEDMTTVVNPSMPLTHFRIFFCDQLDVIGLHNLARFQCQTLESVQIVDSMWNGPIYYEIDVNEQDPFVMMAWKCKKLTRLTIIGVAIQEHDAVAIARLRGRQLQKFELLDECVTPPYMMVDDDNEFEEDFLMSYESFCEEISTCIGHDWQPLTADDVDSCLYDYNKKEIPAFLPVLLADPRTAVKME